MAVNLEKYILAKQEDEKKAAEAKVELKALGIALKEDLKSKGISQKELARACNVSQMTVTNLVLGKHNPSMDTLVKINRYLKGRE